MLWGSARHAVERPATFRDVLGVGEFRAIYGASTLSWFGDYVARAAITALVYDVTGSVAASAAAFAISYAPWLLGGSVLVSIAERYPYRSVMVTCDVARAALMLCVAIPMPSPLMLLFILAAAFFSPPFDAARSATLPSVLPGDRYVVGIALQNATAQPAQVTGYLAGASLAAVDARLALLINAGTFAVSALVLRFGVRRREPALSVARRTDLLAETADGFRLVFRTPALRALVLCVFCGSMFVVVPEGLGAPWAAELVPDGQRGLAQGMIMASVPAGSILGALTISRLVPPAIRRRLLRPLALLSPVTLVPVLVLEPTPAVIAFLAGACGFGIGALVPIANGEFVRALPNSHRARAFGVVSGGLQVVQGTAVLLAGLLARNLAVSRVVGAWSLGGLLLMTVLILTWPPRHAFDEAVASAERANASPPPRHAAPDDEDENPAPPPRSSDGAASPQGGTAVRFARRLVTTAARRRAPTGQPGTMEP